MTTLLALTTALCWGAGTFLGGTGSRKKAPVRVSLGTLLMQFLISAVMLVVVQPPFNGTSVLWGAAAGAGAGIGLTLFYNALARGRMGPIGAVSASLAAFLPFVSDVVRGTNLTALAIFGVVVGLIAVALLCLKPQETAVEASPQSISSTRGTTAILLAFLTGLALGSQYISFGEIPEDAYLWGLFAMRITSVTLILPYAKISLGSLEVGSIPWGLMAVIAVTYTAGDFAFLQAAETGSLAIVAVLSSLHPGVAAILARIIEAEKLSLRQYIGMALAITGVAFVSTN